MTYKIVYSNGFVLFSSPSRWLVESRFDDFYRQARALERPIDFSIVAEVAP